jgi:transposase
MTSHLKIKVRTPEEFGKTRDWVAAHTSGDEREILLDALDIYEDFNAVMREKNISMDNLKDVAFGSGTEKISMLFDDIIDVTPPEATEDNEDNATDKPRTGGERAKRRNGKGHGRRNLKLHAHVETVPCPHSIKAGESCPACKSGKVHPFRTASKTCVSAVNLFVVQVFELESLRCGSCSAVTTAEEPKALQECYGKYHPSAIATLAVLRYAFGFPSYRLRDFTALQGVEISDPTQFRLFEFAANAAGPIVRLLANYVANSKLLFRDDSPMRIIDLKKEIIEKKRDAIRKGESTEDIRTAITTTAVHARTYIGHDITLYATGTQHAGEVFDEIMHARVISEKILAMADAASLNRDHSHADKTIELACKTHARRNFYKLRNYHKKDVADVLELFAHIYKVDGEAKDKGLSPEARLEYHKENSMAAMHMLFVLSRVKRLEHEENSKIYAAYQYLENHWSRLTAFLWYPGAELENSEAERAIKWAIRHRNNSLFYKTEYGAMIGDILMSLIRTARNCGIDPIKYLQDVIVHAADVKERTEQWLPWNWRTESKAYPKAA